LKIHRTLAVELAHFARRILRTNTPKFGRLLLACMVAAVALSGSVAAFAQDTQLATAKLDLPEKWTLEMGPHFEFSNMPTATAVAIARDPRVTVYFVVIDPFGIDNTPFDLMDILSPTLLDLLSLTGADAGKMRVRKSECEMAGTTQPGLLVIYPDGDEARLVSGMACGLAEPTRWAAAFVVVEAGYDRPLLLKKSLDEANSLLASFRFSP